MILSVEEVPVSETSAMLTVGAVLSSVKASGAVPVTPAVLVSLATIVCAPSDRLVGEKDQVPFALAVAVADTALPSTLK